MLMIVLAVSAVNWWAVGSSEKEDFHQQPDSPVGYYTGRNVTSKEDGNDTTWYVLDPGPKIIVYEHELNIYDNNIKELAISKNIPLFVRTGDTWYKVEVPPPGLREYLFWLPVYANLTDLLKIRADDFKPAVVKIQTGKIIEC